MSTPILEKPAFQPTEEKLVTLHGITWEQFKAIEAQLENNRSVKLTYLAGVMEIMSPLGEEHEYVKSTLGLLLEGYMREKEMRFYKLGGFTLEIPGYASGSPDESYSIGSRQKIPDIVIEIIVTSGSVNKRELYKPHKVPEIWFWKSNQLKVFQFQDEDYQEVSRSQFFPDLDLSLLVHYLGYEDQYDAVKEFTQVIRGQG